MKVKRILTFALAVSSIAVLSFISGCKDDIAVSPDLQLKSTNTVSEELPDCGFITVSSIELTEVEIEMLKFVREEEKMARDVYQFYSEKFKKPIFKNIAKSEQFHMDAVLCLLIHFNIEDPASDLPGVFANTDLQDMYNDLISLGTGTITDALTAGATIEDFDIKDINDWIALTGNETIVSVFTSLVCGSGNHLISFTTLLDAYDASYTPVYTEQETFDAILAAGHQYCGL